MSLIPSLTASAGPVASLFKAVFATAVIGTAFQAGRNLVNKADQAAPAQAAAPVRQMKAQP